jgi:hypothetical protein
MADEEKKDKKIIVDEDWKQQAQKEKEKLAEEEKKEEQSGGDQQGQQSRKLPKGDFSGLVSMLATQAMFAMGLIQPEGQEKREPDMELARYNIDMLEALQEKTEGNLESKEEDMLRQALDQLRMAFVKMNSSAGSSGASDSDESSGK